MDTHFSFKKRVEFADTDAAGIMHFANFFRFMEVCEHAFFRSLGLSVHPFGADKGTSSSDDVGWPRVHASCDYKKALKFEDEVEIELRIEELNAKTLIYLFEFWRNSGDSAARVLVATGKLTLVCVVWDRENDAMKAVEIPTEIRSKLEQVLKR